MIEVTTRRGKLQFRLIETNLTPEQIGARGVADPCRGIYGRGDRQPYIGLQALGADRPRSCRCAGRLRCPHQRAGDHLPFQRRRCPPLRDRSRRKMSESPSPSLFDNEVLSAPIIREPILGGSGQISGSFTVQDANDMAILLRAGNCRKAHPDRATMTRLTVGAIEVTALSDGPFPATLDSFIDFPARRGRAAHRQRIGDPLFLPLNCYLLRLGTQVGTGRYRLRPDHGPRSWATAQRICARSASRRTRSTMCC